MVEKCVHVYAVQRQVPSVKHLKVTVFICRQTPCIRRRWTSPGCDLITLIKNQANYAGI